MDRVRHPDRFSQDRRLQKMAEESVRQINLAYENLLRYFSVETADTAKVEPTTSQSALTLASEERALPTDGRRILARNPQSTNPLRFPGGFALLKGTVGALQNGGLDIDLSQRRGG